MKSILISTGIFAVNGVIIGVIAALIIPDIAWWQIGAIMAITSILNAAGNEFERCIKRKQQLKNGGTLGR